MRPDLAIGEVRSSGVAFDRNDMPGTRGAPFRLPRLDATASGPRLARMPALTARIRELHAKRDEL
jgi:hypothetical protein